jgi:C2 domain
MHCKDGRVLELSVVVTVAPGYLSSHTTIVRFLPRYAVVNNLPYPIRIWQDSSIFRPLSADGNISVGKVSKWTYGRGYRRNHAKVNQYESLWGRSAILDEREASSTFHGTTAHGSALYIATVYPSEILPFSLPDSRGERQLRVDPGNPWNLTGSISADKPGDFILTVDRVADLKATPHVSTRSSPHYEVRLPPVGSNLFDGELGIWFEPEYGTSRRMIVKAVKRNTYAFNETDVHIGDELLQMNGVPMAGMPFPEAVALLKSRMSELSSKRQAEVHRRATVKQGRSSIAQTRKRQGNDLDPSLCQVTHIILTFCTVEERIRKVRLRAADVNRGGQESEVNLFSQKSNSGDDSLSVTASDHNFFLHAELKSSPRSNLGIFLVLREEPRAPFEIQNQSVAFTLYYRQRGCHHCPWQSVKPGQSKPYSWEEPLKPKRLIARVALDIVFHIAKVETDQVPANSRKKRVKALSESVRSGQQKLQSEEEAIFSQSVVIPLEEVGYREILSVDGDSLKKDETLSSAKYLKLEVDVEGTARVLYLHDIAETSDDGLQKITRDVDTLKQKMEGEEKRLSDLQSLSRFLDDPDNSEIDDDEVRRQMELCTSRLDDFAEEATITGCHQIIVEVLEARGLNPESFIDSCNPYCEVRLKGRHDRKTIFREIERRRTYLIRKTVNPVWNDQSFVFQVPSEAVAVTYGHSIRIRVRNFRVLGNNPILGRAQVDLHSVRDQKPLMGWFPLVGRTDRRELNSQISHWGRGSIKLRVQWIYSIPALVQYFAVLSERRVLVLCESLSGMAKQEAKRKEVEKDKLAGMDGLKAVRMEELLSFTKKSRRKVNTDQIQQQRVAASTVKRNSERFELPDKSFVNTSTFGEDYPTSLPLMHRPHLRHKDAFRKNLHDYHGILKGNNSSHDVLQDLEDRISQKRLNFHRYTSSRHSHRVDDASTSGNGAISVSFFHTWNMVQALLNDIELEIELDENKIKLFLGKRQLAVQSACRIYHSELHRAVTTKLSLPPGAPQLMHSTANLYIDEFLQSRTTFERSARISMKTVLHPGGWLSIRPVTALNLPDMYTGMTVKVRYGSETYMSETADARSLDPSWYKVNPIVPEEEQWEVVSHGDIHIHVAPQKTSGVIRLSVVGERSQQQLNTKSELGVLYLPLGSTISACLDHDDSRHKEEAPNVPMLLRWFPLTTPLNAIKIEGDEGLSTRPPDSEKISDTDFKEYFAPCIQLAIFWSPENDTGNDNHVDDNSQGSLSYVRRNQSSPDSHDTNAHDELPVVKSYFNADIGWVSVALLDSQRACELLALNIKEADIRYWVTTAKTRMGFSVGWLQLDYQDDDVREPVVLAPTPTDVLSPVIQTLALKDNLRSMTDILSFDFIDVSIAELDFTVEERLLFDLMIFWTSIRARKSVHAPMNENRKENVAEGNTSYKDTFLMTESIASDGTDLLSILMADPSKTEKNNKIYIKELVIGVIKINISYLKGKTRDALVNMPADRLLRIASGELLQQFFYHDDKADVYLSWTQSTLDDERRVENEGTLISFFYEFGL